MSFEKGGERQFTPQMRFVAHHCHHNPCYHRAPPSTSGAIRPSRAEPFGLPTFATDVLRCFQGRFVAASLLEQDPVVGLGSGEGQHAVNICRHVTMNGRRTRTSEGVPHMPNGRTTLYIPALLVRKTIATPPWAGMSWLHSSVILTLQRACLRPLAHPRASQTVRL